MSLRSLIRLSLLVAFVGGAPLAGCKKTPTVEELAAEDLNNPVKNFQNGVQILQTPDKSGVTDYATAYQRFTTAAELFDGKSDKTQAAKAHFNAAWTAEILGQGADAERHYRAAYEADATYEKAMFSLAGILTAEGKHDDAIALYRAYLEQKPDSLDVRNDLVSALASAGKYEEAVKEAQDILLRDPKNATVYRNLSAMYYKQGNYGMSQLCAEKSLALNEGDSGTYNNLGVTLLLQADEPGAIDKFKTAIKLDDDNYEANMNLGYVALNSGDYTLALACFTKATKANPGSVDAKLGLAVAQRGTKEYDKSSATYDLVIKTDPKGEIAYFNAATLHELYTKDYAKALKYLQAYVDAHPGQIGPSHEVFGQMDKVRASQEAEKARLAELKRLEDEKKARDERAKAALTELQTLTTALEGKLTANASCLPPELIEEVQGGLIDTAKQVIEAKDTGMAQDVKSMFTDYYGPMVDETIAAMCGGGAPPTEEAPEEVPAEGTPPAEAPPAEGAPPEGGAP